MSETLEAWTDFNVALVGATAALVGLVIVAMSVNIVKIMASTGLPPRAASSIATLGLAIVAGALGLVPGQPVDLYGWEVLVGALVTAVFQVHSMRVIAGEAGVSVTDRVLKSSMGVVPIAAFLVGAVLIIAGAPSAGLIAVGIGSVLAIVAAIIMAWVVLVEVLR